MKTSWLPVIQVFLRVAATAYQLAQQFITMVQTHTAEVLDSWLENSSGSEIVDLQNFAVGIQQDYHAVRAALETEWSNGQTEG